MKLFRDRTYTATGLAHLSVDVLNSQIGILLAFLSGPLQLSNLLIGVVSTFYSLAGSLSQPIFGWRSDRGNAKSYALGGVLWMVVCFAIALMIPGRIALIILIIGAFGSAAFHPAGTAESTRRGQNHLVQMETTAASIFFFFGQGGLFLGPLIGGPLLDLWGKEGLYLLFLIAIPSAIFLQRAWQAEPSNLKVEERDLPRMHWSWLASPGMIAFILLIFFRAWAQMSVNAFLPKHLFDLGFRPSIFGPITALFMGGSAIGGVVGGWLADRYGNRVVAFWSLALGTLPLIGLAHTQAPLLIALINFMAGALIGGPHSIIIVLAQRRMPGQMGAASGLVLGFTFASGALGNLLSGVLADWLDLPRLFMILAVVCCSAALLTLSLKRREDPQAIVAR